MFFDLFNSLFGEIAVFNCLYFRLLVALVFSFLFTIYGLKYLISYLKSHEAFQPIRVEGPEGHLITKQKTPTMGGIVLSLAVLCSGLLFCKPDDIYVIGALIISTSFAIIGLIDDVIKVFYKNTNGFKGSIKFILQVLISGMVILWLLDSGSSIMNDQSIFIPYFKVMLYIGILFIPFLITVIVGSTNAVNLTDGLDGLVIVPVMICAFVMGLISIFASQDMIFVRANQDNLSQLSIICSAVIGSGFGFFLYNRHPAKIFMGDVGSLMYGSLLGCLAVMLGHEIFYAIAGLLFVIEASSSILQVASYKLFKKRIFKMAPIHHHFEKMGWSERKVVYVFWSFSVICMLIAILGIIKG